MNFSINYYEIKDIMQNIILVGSKSNLQASFIGVVGSLIAILFSILITIVASSSNKYPSNFIDKISQDPKTKKFYFFLVSAIIFQIFLYFMSISSIIFDILYVLIIFICLFRYWKYILGFLDPIKSIENMHGSKLEKEIGEFGDYVKIGLENKNDNLINKAMGKLSKLGDGLKNG